MQADADADATVDIDVETRWRRLTPPATFASAFVKEPSECKTQPSTPL
jgi:hypothetical protein